MTGMVIGVRKAAVGRAHRLKATRRLLKEFGHTPALYPVTCCYLAGVIALLWASTGLLKVEYAIVVLGFASMIIIMVAMKNEVATVHYLVDHQHDLLNDRIEQLTQTILDVRPAVKLPDDPVAATRTSPPQEVSNGGS